MIIGRTAGLLFLLAVIVLGIAYFALFPPPPPPDQLVTKLTNFSSLKGWTEDDQRAAFLAFRRSCASLLSGPDERSLGADGMAGTVGDWRSACTAAQNQPDGDNEAARRFFQTWFRPTNIRNNGDEFGTFTGYYEPILRGSRGRSERYRYPLYEVPKHYVSADLGEFKKEWAGQRVVGRVIGNRLRPPETRAEIDAGALEQQARVLLWVDDPIDVFFLHIQGSGIVELAEGGRQRVGYAGANGHAYTAVGRVLVARGEVPLEQMSMQAIRQWLRANPEQAQALMNENASYVFFRPINGAAAIGSMGVELTPGRSLAVDPKWIALGIPIWLDTFVKEQDEKNPGPTKLRGLFVAQDTGGAIKGIVRGDVFWGSGDEAAAAAGVMREWGRYYALLPRELLQRRARDEK
ncbi:MAG: murein transglycosylase [Alphaproteobacteria bacterium]|nr:murein transglycosylase [Alphaproteobacteria bacterium]